VSLVVLLLVSELEFLLFLVVEEREEHLVCQIHQYSAG
jgi:hypothetical protein